jgi:hypothetical protein
MWPNDSLVGSVAMWLLGLFFRPGNIFKPQWLCNWWTFLDEYVKDIELKSNVASILKLYALAAHRYPLVNLPWTDYSVEYASAAVILSSNIIAYGESINLAPLPVGTPATLCYLAHYSKSRSYHGESSTVSAPFAAATIYTQPLRVKDSSWQRGFSYTFDPVPQISCVFQLGSMEGIWQGIFTASIPLLFYVGTFLTYMSSIRNSRRIPNCCEVLLLLFFQQVQWCHMGRLGNYVNTSCFPPLGRKWRRIAVLAAKTINTAGIAYRSEIQCDHFFLMTAMLQNIRRALL